MIDGRIVPLSSAAHAFTRELTSEMRDPRQSESGSSQALSGTAAAGLIGGR
jgi:hypothetical protein